MIIEPRTSPCPCSGSGWRVLRWEGGWKQEVSKTGEAQTISPNPDLRDEKRLSGGKAGNEGNSSGRGNSKLEASKVGDDG